MPNWKKVVVSGSATSLSSLYVDTSLTASIISGSQITGSLFGTASYAISSSYSDFATTASFALNFNPQATASYALEALTASYALNVPTGSVSSSYALSASYAETASYALAISDQGFQFTQSTPSTTWNILHNLNTLTPLVDVYDSIYHQLIPAEIISVDLNNIQIVFSSAQTGYVIVSKGSGVSQVSVSASYASYAVTASYATTVGFNFEQISPASTWTINHNLNNRHPLVQIYDSSHLTFIPQSISGSSANTVIVTFSSAISGYARVV